MEQLEHLLAELAGLVGIIPEYYDVFGARHVASLGSKQAILSAMGLQVGTAQQVRRQIAKVKTRAWRSVLDPATIISVHCQPHNLAVHLALPEGKEQAAAITLTLECEHGKSERFHFPAGTLCAREQRIIEGQRFIRILLPLPKKDMGYYEISLTCTHPEQVFGNSSSSVQGSGRLIVTPDCCYMPEELKTGKTWGIAVNLYSLRSGRNWGFGDLGDLRSLVSWAADLGAGLVGINPLHALPNTDPFGISPYSPISRLYKNFLYLDMDRIDELAGVSLPAGIAEKIGSLRKSEYVDYGGVARVKRELLEQAYEIFYRDHHLAGSVRGKAFRSYLDEEGPALEEYAIFCALSEYLKKEHQAVAWETWPEAYRSPASEAVAVFRKAKEKQVLFFAWLQWLLDSQMAEAAASSSRGMAVGLYGDLAIGADRNGSDGWTYQDVLAEQVTVGCPPDDFNQNGQDWGFPPMIPDKLRESGYELFIRTIRKNMEHLGALRIDHALGLFRLFWIPGGRPAAEGAYVRCRAEDLLRIIALESVRNKTLVIGEDLGTITDEARRMLHSFGMLSYRLFYFERSYPNPSFLPPEHYPVMALAAVTTHDLPTLSGYWAGRDLDVKKQLGIIKGEEAFCRLKGDRERDRRLVLQALEQQGMRPAVGPSAACPMTPGLCSALYRYLAASPAKLVLVSLDDVIGTMDQQNLPGTVAEYPNWKQKTPLSLEEIMADPRWKDLAQMLRNIRAANRADICRLH